jgi:hypothetical protein
VAVGVLDAVDAKFLVELGTLGRVASMEGLHQSAGLFDEVLYLLGREPIRRGARVPELGFGGSSGGGDLGDPMLYDGGVGAGLYGGPVAVKATLAVDQNLLGGPPMVTIWGAAADGGQGVAGVVEVGWAEQFRQPVVEAADQVDLA